MGPARFMPDFKGKFGVGPDILQSSGSEIVETCYRVLFYEWLVEG